ncbi:hypothetical protein CH063_03844 [Colletotrichum higginsianum]|uniref:Uncharacterized protein n=1 Tax=Colletotrichum higginsianum (strain IMI 349063) TaxID=759273 RepID=H1W1H3_COLHI|nr:hypothetical protein CH063_03844 [Colletotrichum higginsianum]
MHCFLTSSPAMSPPRQNPGENKGPSRTHAARTRVNGGLLNIKGETARPGSFRGSLKRGGIETSTLPPVHAIAKCPSFRLPIIDFTFCAKHIQRLGSARNGEGLRSCVLSSPRSPSVARDRISDQPQWLSHTGWRPAARAFSRWAFEHGQDRNQESGPSNSISTAIKSLTRVEASNRDGPE